MKKISLLLLVFFLKTHFCESQILPFKTRDTCTYKSFCSSSTGLSYGQHPSYSESVFQFGVQSINPAPTFFFIYKKCKNPSTDLGLDLDKAVVQTRVGFPIVFTLNPKGKLTFSDDSVVNKNTYLEKFKAISKSMNLNDSLHGISSSIKRFESLSFSEIVLIYFPELEILGKAIHKMSEKKPYEIKDKEVFNDFIFDYNDTIKLSKKTSLKINKFRDRRETIYRMVIDSIELKNYVLEKYPKAWKKMEKEIDKSIRDSYEKKLKKFQPLWQEKIRIVTLKAGNVLLKIEYTNDEELMLMGGTHIKYIIEKE